MAGPRREIDRAAAARGAARAASMVVRCAEIAAWFLVAVVAFPWFLARRRTPRGAAGHAVAFLFRHLGATFIKVGQILSTRPDLFSPAFLAPLVELQDRVPPFSFAEARAALEADLERPVDEVFRELAEAPVASASVAQVHRGVLRDDGRVVAVKIRRPGIIRRADLDEAILRFGARCLSLVPTVARISPVEAVAQFCEAVNRQLDFRIEAANNRRFRENFADDPHVVFPALVDAWCTDRILVMDFVEGVKDDRLAEVRGDPAFLARKGIEVICRMIYHHGFVHADLHPGNIFYLPGNRVALLDLGLVATLDDDARRRIATMNFFMATGQGKEVARVICENASFADVRDYPAYERDVAALVARVANRPVDEIQVTAVIAELFDILRRHRIRADATFTVVNIALMVAEGLGRKLDPSLNPSVEARPWLEAALGLATAGA